MVNASSAWSVDLALAAVLHGLRDTHLEPAHASLEGWPVNGVPPGGHVRRRTGSRDCRHLLSCVRSVLHALSRSGTRWTWAPFRAEPTLVSVPLQGGIRFFHPPHPHPRGLALRLACPAHPGGDTGLPRSAFKPRSGRSHPCAGGPSSARGDVRAPRPVRVPFGPRLSASFGVLAITALQWFTCVDHSIRPWLPCRLDAGSVEVPSRGASSGRESMGYIVPRASHHVAAAHSAPTSHVPVGYRRQNAGLRPRSPVFPLSR